MRFLPYSIVGVAVVIAAFPVVSSRFQDSGIIQDAKKGTPALSKHFEPQTNNDGAVTIVILPQNISESGPWEFKVTLDTHSGALDADMVAVSVLVDDAGQKYTPPSRGKVISQEGIIGRGF